MCHIRKEKRLLSGNEGKILPEALLRNVEASFGRSCESNAGQEGNNLVQVKLLLAEVFANSNVRIQVYSL